MILSHTAHVNKNEKQKRSFSFWVSLDTTSGSLKKWATIIVSSLCALTGGKKKKKKKGKNTR